MKLHVWLVRHAVAWDRQAWSGKESERPLTEEGIKQYKQFIKTLPWRPKWYGDPWLLISSDYTRAVQTTDLFERFTRKKNIPVTRGLTTAQLRPQASPFSFRKMLLEQIVRRESFLLSSAQDNRLHVFCFSHEPYLSRLAFELIFPRKTTRLDTGSSIVASAPFLRFKKGAFLHLIWPKLQLSRHHHESESQLLQNLSQPAQIADFWRP